MRQTYAEILSNRRPARRLLTTEGRIALALAAEPDDPRVRFAVAIANILGTGARLADEIGSPEIAWSTVPEILETFAAGAWPGKAEDVEPLRELPARAAYDLVRRTLDRLVDAQLAEVSPATQEPREGSRVYRLAP